MKKYLQLWLTLCCLVGTALSYGQISAPAAASTQMTNYTNGMPPDPIFIFCDPNFLGNPVSPSLTATPPGGVPGWKFEWFSYSQALNTWVPLTTVNNAPSSTINNLSSGGYRVVITDGNNVVQGCYRCWVWHKQTAININPVAAGCEPFTIQANVVSNNSFTYYNPPPDPFIVRPTTQITVCFRANHTYVSDLGFFLIGPPSCGSPIIPLAPHPEAINAGNGCCCNGGNNVNNLCFSTQNTNMLNVCGSGTPLTGNFGIYGQGTPNNYGANNNNWSPIFGCDAAQGGWRVQIYDCIGADVGALTNATITFTDNAACGQSTITYNSGNINSAINDNSCSQQTASIYTVPPPPPTVAQTLNATTGYSWTASPGYAGFPAVSNNPSLTVNPVPEQDTWFYLTVTSSVGCINIDSVFFDYTPPDTPHIAIPPIFCFNGPGDTLSVDIDGGVWSGPGITDTITGFFNPVVAGPGDHQIIYTAEQPCGERDTVTVTVAPEITIAPQITNSSCFNADDAMVNAILLTGDMPIMGTWNTVPPQMGFIANNLAPGVHRLILQDIHGCRDTSYHTTTEPQQLTLATNVVHVNCPNGSNGQASVTAAGGTVPYGYSWNSTPVQTTSTATGLAAGNYTVTVTDFNGCQEQANVTLNTLSAPPLIQGTVKHESCQDVYDGAIDVTPVGGTGPFTYLWNTNDTSEDISAITQGNYTVTLTDIYQCTYSNSFTVTSGNAMDYSFTTSNVLCYSEATGVINVTPLSGNPPYNYFLNGVSVGSSGQLGNLHAGTYTVNIVDSRGCDTSFVASISQPPPLSVDSTHHQLRLGDNITLSPSIGGGTGTLVLQWIPFYNLSCPDCMTPLAWPEITTHYNVVVTDQNGCTETAQVIVDVFHDGPFIPNAFTPGNKDDLNNMWRVSDYGVEKFELLIFDRWGTKMYESENIYEGWDGKTPGGKLCEGGVYAYKTHIRYIDGTEKTVLGHVTIVR